MGVLSLSRDLLSVIEYCHRSLATDFGKSALNRELMSLIDSDGLCS